MIFPRLYDEVEPKVERKPVPWLPVRIFYTYMCTYTNWETEAEVCHQPVSLLFIKHSLSFRNFPGNRGYCWTGQSLWYPWCSSLQEGLLMIFCLLVFMPLYNPFSYWILIMYVISRVLLDDCVLPLKLGHKTHVVSWITCFWGLHLTILYGLQQPYGKVHYRNWHLCLITRRNLWIMCVSLLKWGFPAPVKPCDDCSPGWHLTATSYETLSQNNQLSHSQISNS